MAHKIILLASALILVPTFLAAPVFAAPKVPASTSLSSDEQWQADNENFINQRIAKQSVKLLNDPASPALGNPHGDIVIVEFFDYACPFCKATEPRLETLLKSDRGVKIILKEFPILTPELTVASKVALAAVKQGKYAQFHQALLNYKGRLQTQVIFDTAQNVGLDIGRIRKDMTSPEISDEFLANLNLARSIRAFETPIFIVDGHIITGASAKIDFPKLVAEARTRHHDHV